MTVFVVIAAVLAALSLLFLLPPLLRSRSGLDVDRARANLGVLKDQLAELEADHARGAVGDEQYAEIKAELERRVLDDVQSHAEAPAATPLRSRWPAIVVGVLVPVAAALLYTRLGDPAAFDPGLQTASQDPAEGHLSGEQLEQMVTALQQRLEKEPENAAGWSTLARTYYQMRRFSDAVKAYEKLEALIPDDANLLADYADAAAMAQGRKFEGKPRELVARALKIDPTQWKALAMAGTDAFEQGNFKQAVAQWETLRTQLPPDSPIAQSIGESIAEARQRAGMPPATASATPPAMAQAPSGVPRGPMPQDDVHKSAAKGVAPAAAAAAPPSPAAAAVAAGATTVSGTVALSPALKAKAAPTDIVFIFARPAQGPRMPLALTQVQVKDLPAKFTLDDSQAMSPNFRLSGQSEVIIGARISKTGNPMPASGDLEGLSTPVKIGAKDAAITIDSVLP
ncbi:MAG: c-type cytochrome biogenesis protein CcmI [Burkholderiaceae bacterium]|nr:c-type cytochrome biogenesis protein CcmI [Burkholderiaceae bacterium]